MERVNQTLKCKLYHYFMAVNSLCYGDVLQDVYIVQDLLERLIQGTLYGEELQMVKWPDIFRIEKVYKKHTKNKKTEYLVHWSGYRSDFYSWIQSSDIELIAKE